MIKSQIKLVSAVSAILAGLVFIPARAQDCTVSTCTCEIKMNDKVEHSTPPSCVNASSVSFGLDNSFENKSGCCLDQSVGCNKKECRFKVVISVKANDGQTCNFRIIPPGGADNPANCPGASQCTFSSSAPRLLQCGHKEEYQIKIGGTLIWSADAECEQCEQLAQ